MITCKEKIEQKLDIHLAPGARIEEKKKKRKKKKEEHCRENARDEPNC